MTRKQLSLGLRVNLITKGSPVGVDGSKQWEPPFYESTESAHQNRNPYKDSTNILPFNHFAHQPPTPPALRPSPIGVRVELYRLIYGAGMFVLGILAHMAWLRAWL